MVAQRARPVGVVLVRLVDLNLKASRARWRCLLGNGGDDSNGRLGRDIDRRSGGIGREAAEALGLVVELDVLQVLGAVLNEAGLSASAALLGVEVTRMAGRDFEGRDLAGGVLRLNCSMSVTGRP